VNMVVERMEHASGGRTTFIYDEAYNHATQTV
jgi:hypothetical protein